jgi:hypothetical protein
VRKRDDAEVRHRFNIEGASWFDSVRNKNQQNSNESIWTKFIETVAYEYHRRYSIVVHEAEELTKEQKQNNLKTADKIGKRLFDIFFDAGGKRVAVVPEDAEGDNSIDSIYSATLRLEINGGTGASVPVLCKVYFHADGNVLQPMNSAAVSEIDEHLNELLRSDIGRQQKGNVAEGLKNAGAANTDMINQVLGAVERLASNTYQETFFDYVCYCDEKYDASIIKRLLEQQQHDSASLECTEVRVLGITCIKYRNSIYKVYLEGKPALKISIGFNDSLNVECANCSEHDSIIRNNYINYEVDGVKKSVLLDFSGDVGVGLSPEQIEEVKLYSQLGKHLMLVSCPENIRNKSCRNHMCASQTFEVEYAGSSRRLCRGCQFPEMVFIDGDGRECFTRNLTFDSVNLSFVDKDKMGKCAMCGRSVDEEYLSGNLCPTCSAARGASETDKLKAHSKYKKYAGFLSLGRRMFPPYNERYCYEDKSMLIFFVGKRTYVWNKLDGKEKGYMKKPHKIRFKRDF